MATIENIMANLFRTSWVNWKNKTLVKKEQTARIIITTFRFLAVVVAALQVFVFRVDSYSLMNSVVLISLIGAGIILEGIHPLRWYKASSLAFGLLAIDLAISCFLVISTGGLSSPFLLYSLAPVLRSALFLGSRITFGAALVSFIYVFCGQVFNPFFNLRLSDSELSYYFIFVAAVSLSAVLPYLINVNLRQRLEAESILQERQRLSHEIHDGCAQTVSVLLWQVQLLRRKLQQMGISLNEIQELENLAKKAQYETRESLEMLRNYRGDGSLLPYLKDYIGHLHTQTPINYTIKGELGKLRLDPAIELELLRICQEALTNIRKHAKARNVTLKVEPDKNRLKLTITDDGCGFTLNKDGEVNQSNGHGLRVMQERASLLGAELDIVSAPGCGTIIKIETPIS